MPLLRRQFIRLASAAAGAAVLPSSARPQLQSYPNKVIKIVVPFPAGGPTDLMARLAGQHLSTALGQNVIIENLAGAGGTIGSQTVARANRMATRFCWEARTPMQSRPRSTKISATTRSRILRQSPRSRSTRRRCS